MTISLVYSKLASAYRKGKGVRLTAEELSALVLGDTAIETVISELIAEMESDEAQAAGEAAAHLNGSWG